MVIKYEYRRTLGKKLNLKNPKTLNEKINWLKLYERVPLQTICADKFLVRDYIKDKIGEEYLIPLVYQTKNTNEIKPENLPDYPIILKTNHNSSGGLIVRDKDKVDWEGARSRFKKLLKENYFISSREWQYKNIEPRIVVEKLLMDEEGNIPIDLKFHCFNGKLVFTQVDLDRHTHHKRNLYDVDWNRIPCKWIYDNGNDIAKPSEYDKMRELAEKIAPDFTYVRVDFYQIGTKIFFGELTFHSESGIGFFEPSSYDDEFGSMLDISHLTGIPN